MSARDVAKWMAAKVDSGSILYQDAAASQIRAQFGEQYVYMNKNRNLAINKNVLTEFRNLAPDAVWERGARCWRQRRSYDKPGRQQN